MKLRSLSIPILLLIVLLSGCASLDHYQQADSYKSSIKSLAVLPLIIGDERGRIETIGDKELEEFVQFFSGSFYAKFEQSVNLINNMELKLPGRDFDMAVSFDQDYLGAANKLGADAVLGISLTLYNEVKPAAKGAQVAAAVVTSVLFGGYIKENQIVKYETHYGYLNTEVVADYMSFEFGGLEFPSIEEQRTAFVDRLVEYLDIRFPLSTDYVPLYE